MKFLVLLLCLMNMGCQGEVESPTDIQTKRLGKNNKLFGDLTFPIFKNEENQKSEHKNDQEDKAIEKPEKKD